MRRRVAILLVTAAALLSVLLVDQAHGATVAVTASSIDGPCTDCDWG